MGRVVRLRITDPAELAPFRSHGPSGPLLSGVVFHGMDNGPSFEAAQSLLLRGIETPCSTPTAMALCIARSFGLRSLLPDRAVRPACPVGGLQLHRKSTRGTEESSALESSGAGMNTHAGAGRVAEVEEPAVVEGEGCAAGGRETSLRGESN